MRINGVGTTWLGATAPDAQGCVHATLWFTLLFLPLIPLRRAKLQRLPHRGSGFSVRELERTPLVVGELGKTWAFSLVVPVVALGPLALGIKELWSALGLPEAWSTPWFVFGIAWLGVVVWKLADWHEQRFHPR